jgi:hypothetical protein
MFPPVMTCADVMSLTLWANHDYAESHREAPQMVVALLPEPPLLSAPLAFVNHHNQFLLIGCINSYLCRYTIHYNFATCFGLSAIIEYYTVLCVHLAVPPFFHMLASGFI